MTANTAITPNIRVTQARVIRSEWIKLRSVRSTKITLALVGVPVIAMGLLISALVTDGVADPTGNSLAGTSIAQLVLGVLGALLFTSEYSTGMIRATLTAVPTRLPVLWGKVVAFGTVSFLVMLGAVAIAFFGGQALYGGSGAAASISDPGVARALLGAALFPTAIALMGLALGAIMRRTASAIGVLFGVLFLAPGLLALLSSWVGDVGSYLPSAAGQAMQTVVSHPEFNSLSPLMGFVVTLGWTGALLAAAAFVLKRRDA